MTITVTCMALILTGGVVPLPLFPSPLPTVPDRFCRFGTTVISKISFQEVAKETDCDKSVTNRALLLKLCVTSKSKNLFTQTSDGCRNSGILEISGVWKH